MSLYKVSDMYEAKHHIFLGADEYMSLMSDVCQQAFVISLFG